MLNWAWYLAKVIYLGATVKYKRLWKCAHYLESVSSTNLIGLSLKNNVTYSKWESFIILGFFTINSGNENMFFIPFDMYSAKTF